MQTNTGQCISSQRDEMAAITFFLPQPFSPFPHLFSLDHYHCLPGPCLPWWFSVILNSKPIPAPSATHLILVCIPKTQRQCFFLVLWYVSWMALCIDLDSSKNFDQSQLQPRPSFSTPTYNPSSLYFREECMRLQHENEQVIAHMQLLR